MQYDRLRATCLEDFFAASSAAAEEGSGDSHVTPKSTDRLK